MDKEGFLKKVAQILGVSKSEKDLAFSILVEKITDFLDPNEALKIPELGYFQIKRKPIKLVEQILESDLGTESKDTLLFSAELSELEDSRHLMFLTFDIPSKNFGSNEIDEQVFNIGFGKPILPLVDENNFNEAETSYILLKKSIEERVYELLSNSDKLKNFDLWEDYLNSMEMQGPKTEEPLLENLNLEESNREEDVPVQATFETNILIENDLSDEIESNDETLSEENEADSILKILEEENATEDDDIEFTFKPAVKFDETEPEIAPESFEDGNNEFDSIEDIKLDITMDLESDEPAIKEPVSIDFEKVEENTEVELTTKISEEEMGEDKNKDNFEWDFEEIHDEDDKGHTLDGEPDLGEDEDLFKKLEASLADDTSKEADMSEMDDEPEEEKVENELPRDSVTTSIKLDRSDAPSEPNIEIKPKSKSYSEMRKNGGGLSKYILGVLAAFVVITFVVVYFFTGKSTAPVSNPPERELATKITPENESPIDQPVTKGEEVIGLSKDEPIEPKLETKEVTSQEQPAVKNVQPSKATGSLLKDFPNEKSVTNLIFYNGNDYYVQVSSHNTLEKAEVEAKRLRSLGHDAFIMKAWIAKFNSNWYRVKIGYFKSEAEARSFQQKNKF